jgi:hypothetical protein
MEPLLDVRTTYRCQPIAPWDVAVMYEEVHLASM